jgi:two-component sensor histidine kinase
VTSRQLSDRILQPNQPPATADAPDNPAPAEELAYRLQQQQLLSEFGLFALGCTDLDPLTQRACELAARGLHTEFAKVLRYRPEQDDLLVYAGVGWKPGVVGHASICADLGSPAGYALKTGEPVISNHLGSETRFRRPQLLADHGIKRAINVLIPNCDDFRGVLEVDSSDGHRFVEADLEYLSGLAQWLGVAMERQRAEDARRNSDERYRRLFDAIDAGFCVIEMKFDQDRHPVDYRFVEVNPAFEAHTGLSDAQGKWMRALASDHEQHWFDIYGRVALTGEPIRFEQRAEALGRWFSVNAFRVGDPDSHRVGILFSDMTDRKRLEILLQDKVAHQETMMREVSHRVKNSLALVGSMLHMQGRAAHDEQVKRAIADAQARVMAIATVHDQLWRQSQVEHIELATFLGDLCAKLQETDRRYRLACDIDPVAVPADQAIPLGLIVNELVTNAFKYAYPSALGGAVDVALRETDGGIRLEVADSGVGLPESVSFGASTKSLGGSMVHALARQLGATLDVDSNARGSRFTLDIPE